MKVIGRIFLALAAGLVLSSIVAAMTALATRRRLVVVDEADADEVHLAAIFEPLAFRSRATAFRGGTLDCWFGGGYVDLREARLDPSGATIRVRTIFGGGQIVVPRDWAVTTRIVGLGGAGDARGAPEPAADAPQLLIEGVAMFGGVGITAELPQAQIDAIDMAIERRRGGRASSPMSPGEPSVV